MPHPAVFFVRNWTLTWHLEDLHSVQQGRGDGGRAVCCGDEEDLWEVKRHVEVMVGEAVVLLRVQNLIKITVYLHKFSRCVRCSL